LVRLQKRFAYKYKEKDHYKYVVTIPSEAVKELQLLPDTELEVAVENRNIVLKPTLRIQSAILKDSKRKRQLNSTRR
jgi:antitoxin component of MazEF toxin-antitoxin module